MSAVNLLLERLKDPDVSSSVVPLFVALAILLSFSLFLVTRIASKVLKMNRARAKGGENKAQAPAPAETIYLHKQGKFRHFFRRVSRAETAPGGDTTELEALRAHAARVEQAHQMERELHSRAISRIAELQGELQIHKDQNQSLTKELDAEIARRKKVEGRSEKLEAQLRDAIQETERLYQKTAKLAESHGAEVEAPSLASPSPEIQAQDELVARQAAEIDRLKSILRQCKERMLEMGKGR